jgi:hypothetical protein
MVRSMPVTPTTSPSPVPSATPSVFVTSPSPLDGSAQFTVLGLLLAVVVYIRNIPLKELSTARETLRTSCPTSEDDIKKKGEKLRYIYFQTVILDIFQIFLVGISVLVAGRSVWWGSKLDDTILWGLFIFPVLFLGFHLVINVKNIIRAIKAWQNL